MASRAKNDGEEPTGLDCDDPVLSGGVYQPPKPGYMLPVGDTKPEGVLSVIPGLDPNLADGMRLCRQCQQPFKPVPACRRVCSAECRRARTATPQGE